MTSEYIPEEIEYDPELPVKEVFYTAYNGIPPNIMLFCTECELSFYNGPGRTTQDLVELTIAEQVAAGHAILRSHTVLKALPDVLM
jgi:hypothetical protein